MFVELVRLVDSCSFQDIHQLAIFASQGPRMALIATQETFFLRSYRGKDHGNTLGLIPLAICVTSLNLPLVA
jgi:hypothetical protein